MWDARELLAECATTALVADLDGDALVELATIDRDDGRDLIDRLVERVVEDLSLADVADTEPLLVAAQRMCRRALHGEITERALTSWVHERFHHESDSRRLDLLAALDDEYDDAVASSADAAEITRLVRETARRYLAYRD